LIANPHIRINCCSCWRTVISRLTVFGSNKACMLIIIIRMITCITIVVMSGDRSWLIYTLWSSPILWLQTLFILFCLFQRTFFSLLVAFKLLFNTCVSLPFADSKNYFLFKLSLESTLAVCEWILVDRLIANTNMDWIVF
jgi:hypothetical protein